MRLLLIALLGTIGCDSSSGALPSDGGGGDLVAAMDGDVAAAEQCPAPAPCGGDLSGHWNLVGACLDTQPQAIPNCSGPTLLGSGEMTGSLDNCSLTFQQNDVTVIQDFPPSCGDCRNLSGFFNGSGPYPTLCAPDDTGGCACRVTVGSASGGGDVCTRTSGACGCPDGGAKQNQNVYDYCVQGNMLTLIRVDAYFPTPNVLTFTRQP